MAIEYNIDMRFLLLLLMVLLVPTSAIAQNTSSGDFDLRALGNTLADDSQSFYDRYVYQNDSTVSKEADLTLPVVDAQEIQEWVSQAIGTVLTLSFTDYQQKMEIAKAYFTESGYQDFMRESQKANLIDVLTQNQYRLITASRYTPSMVNQGVDGTVYRWRFDAPVMMSYFNDDDEASFNMIVTLDIIRVPFSQNTSGLSIDQWSIRSDTGSL